MSAKKPPKQGKHWTDSNIKQLEKLVEQNTPTRLIAYKTGRSTAAIYNKAAEQNISLKPTNQSPYNRRKSSS